MEELRAEQVRANPDRHRYVVDNAYLAGEPGSLIPALAPAFAGPPTAKLFSLWFDLTHLPARPRPDMALSLHTDIYFATYVISQPEADAREHHAWTQARGDRPRPQREVGIPVRRGTAGRAHG